MNFVTNVNVSFSWLNLMETYWCPFSNLGIFVSLLGLSFKFFSATFGKHSASSWGIHFLHLHRKSKTRCIFQSQSFLYHTDLNKYCTRKRDLQKLFFTRLKRSRFCNFSTFGLLFIVLLRVKKKKMKISSQESSFLKWMLHNFEIYVSLRSG